MLIRHNEELDLASALGHSLLMRLVPASHDVRSTPKADIRFQRNICRDGPISDSCSAAKSVLRMPHSSLWQS